MTAVIQQEALEHAAEAIALQIESNELTKKLNDVKERLRKIADGEKLEITVEGKGKVNVSTPREGGELTGKKMTINEEKLEKNAELKKELIRKNIIVVEDVFSSKAAASVTIKPNV